MKRTRKWAYVEQEAKRLAELALSAPEIAKRLGVNQSTVTRWMACGKLEKRKRRPSVPTSNKNPAQWAAAVRRDFSLDGTDEELLTLAQTALEMASDPAMAPQVRLSAIGRYQAVVKQLALPARLADQGMPGPTGVTPAPRTPRPDPRGLLMAVKATA